MTSEAVITRIKNILSNCYIKLEYAETYESLRKKESIAFRRFKTELTQWLKELEKEID